MIHRCREALRSRGIVADSLVQIAGRGSVCVSFMERGTAYPVAVAKLYETAEQARRGRAEAAALTRLAPVADRIGAPELVLDGPVGRVGHFTLQIGVPGRPLPDELSSECATLPC